MDLWCFFYGAGINDHRLEVIAAYCTCDVNSWRSFVWSPSAMLLIGGLCPSLVFYWQCVWCGWQISHSSLFQGLNRDHINFTHLRSSVSLWLKLRPLGEEEYSIRSPLRRRDVAAMKQKIKTILSESQQFLPNRDLNTTKIHKRCGN